VGERADGEEVTPVSGDGAGDSATGPPDASVSTAALAAQATAGAQVVERHVVEQHEVGAGVEHLADLLDAGRTRPRRQAGNSRRTAEKAAATPPAATTWLSLTSAASDSDIGG
jgi:hypothetical protein